MDASEIVDQAAAISDSVLFPRAMATDRARLVARRNLDVLADAGLYGIAMPAGSGGLGVDASGVSAVVEALAAGCFTTVFVWMQHHSASRAVASADGDVRRFARAMASGTVRAGVAFAHLRRPGPSAVVASEGPGGSWSLSGVAPWVTGWGRIDLVHVAARVGDSDEIVWCLLDATATDEVRPKPLRLAAANASGTVQLDLRDAVVQPDCVVTRESLAGWLDRDTRGLRTNGSVPLGIASRAAQLMASGGGGWVEAIGAARRALDDAVAHPEAMPIARARACELSMHCTASLVAETGGRSMLVNEHAQRLAREALFAFVQGQTAAIRAAQRQGLTALR